MERFSGGGEMEMSGEEDNLVQSVVDDLRKNGEKRETSSDNRGGEGGGERERGRDWRERENDSITRQKESVVFRVLEERSAAGAKSQAHGLENLSPARNKLDFKKGARSGVSTHMWRQGSKAISINKCHFCHYVRLCQGCPDIQPACL